MKNTIKYEISKTKDNDLLVDKWTVWRIREGKNSSSVYSVFHGTRKECLEYIKRNDPVKQKFKKVKKEDSFKKQNIKIPSKKEIKL